MFSSRLARFYFFLVLSFFTNCHFECIVWFKLISVLYIVYLFAVLMICLLFVYLFIYFNFSIRFPFPDPLRYVYLVIYTSRGPGCKISFLIVFSIRRISFLAFFNKISFRNHRHKMLWKLTLPYEN